MSLLSGVSDFFGLDIGTTAIRLVQLRGSGSVKALTRYAYIPIDSKLSVSDSKSDQQRVAQIIKDLVSQAQIVTKNVAVGIPSQRVFTTVVDIERLNQEELAKTIHLQADALIPTPPSESKIDFAVLGDSPVDKTKIELLLSSVPNDFIESRLDLLESIGLNVIAFEPDNLALTRALIPLDATEPQMVLDIGYKSTDLVISMQGGPRLTRSIPTGTEAIIRSAAQNLNIEDKQEGQVYQAIIGTVDILVSEIEKSIKFFQTRYSTIKLNRVIVTGAASSLPEFPLYVANKFGLNVEIGNSWRNVSFPSERQNDLLAVSSHFGVAAGLAERQE